MYFDKIVYEIYFEFLINKSLQHKQKKKLVL
jgi:hypothetical protein